MASADVNSVRDLFQAVVNDSATDLDDIWDKEGLEKTTKLAQSYNEMGETPLLVAIGQQHHSVMTYLVDVLNVEIGQTGRFISDRVDCADCPPLIAAVISLQPFAIDFLMEKSSECAKPLLDLTSFLSSSITCPHKINVLELMGATCLLSDYTNLRFDGFSYWMEAMKLGSSTADVRYSQIPHHSSIPAFQFTDITSELITLEDLKRMANGELRFDQRLVNERAFRVSQRVLGDMQLYPDIFIISHFMLMMFTKPVSDRSLTRDELQHLSSAAKYTLKLMELWWEKENLSSCTEKKTWPNMMQAISCSFCLFEELGAFVPEYLVPFSDLMYTFGFACEHLHRIYTKFWPSEENHRSRQIRHLTKLVRDLSYFIFCMLPQYSKQEYQQFKQCLYHYVPLYRGSEINRPNLLHEVCCIRYVSAQNEAYYDKFAQLFLEAGEDPNATDSQGNTPLHRLLAKNEYDYHLTHPWDILFQERKSIVNLNYMAVIRLLLDYGCHVDQSNKGGETILELLKRNRRMQSNFDKPFDRYLESVINAVLPLTCYSAQSMRKHNISTGCLPPALQLFVRRH